MMLLAMVVAAHWVARTNRAPEDRGGLLAMGLTAAAMVLLADFAVGTGLRGQSLAEQLARFATYRTSCISRCSPHSP
jgi:hypothetical protein